eukprot:765017-Pelagomonas_calceolata.AAC.13
MAVSFNTRMTLHHLLAQLMPTLASLVPRVLTPAHALQHSQTPRTLHFEMPGTPFTTSTGFH